MLYNQEFMRKFLLSLLILIFAVTSGFGQADSLGIKREGDKYFVIHKVASGQTLYSLARRYGTTVSDIKAKNAELVDELKVGQTINIPYGKPMGQPEMPSKSAQQATKSNVSHTVDAGETLFSISQQYNVDVNDLKKLNGLTSNALAVGQTLKISLANTVKAQETVLKPIKVDVKTEVELAEVKEGESTVPKILSTEKNIIVTSRTRDEYNGTAFEEIVEDGQAELIVEGEPSTKFLALHKTAKVGTVIKVRNRMNDLTVYVRVVGQIPKTADNEKIIIKLNKRAYDQLKALDNRFLVELSYFQ